MASLENGELLTLDIAQGVVVARTDGEVTIVEFRRDHGRHEPMELLRSRTTTDVVMLLPVALQALATRGFQ